jgi:hypothetical protein
MNHRVQIGGQNRFNSLRSESPDSDFPEFSRNGGVAEHGIKSYDWRWTNCWQVPNDSWRNWAIGLMLYSAGKRMNWSNVEFVACQNWNCLQWIWRLKIQRLGPGMRSNNGLTSYYWKNHGQISRQAFDFLHRNSKICSKIRSWIEKRRYRSGRKVFSDLYFWSPGSVLAYIPLVKFPLGRKLIPHRESDVESQSASTLGFPSVSSCGPNSILSVRSVQIFRSLSIITAWTIMKSHFTMVYVGVIGNFWSFPGGR